MERLDIKSTLTRTLRAMRIACTLNTADLARQSARWRALGVRRELTPDGLRLSFDNPDEQELRELVAIESECCAWAQWHVDGREVVVTSTGHGIETLHSMFG